MSNNMIKAYSIAYDKEKIKTLDFGVREKEVMQRLKEILPSRPLLAPFDEEPGTFIPGLPAENLDNLVDNLLSEPDGSFDPGIFLGPEPAVPVATEVDIDAIKQSLREEIMAEMSPILQRKGDDIVANAKAQANGLIEASKRDAEIAKESILRAASAQGYEEGKARAKAEEEKVKAEYAAKTKQLEQEYERRFAELEPAFASIVTELVEKLTNVSYENHKEIIFYLIETGLGFAQKDTYFDVVLSEADYEKYEELFPEVKERYQDKLVLEFKKDATLPDGSCKLENENRVIDCGLGLRLGGLLDDLSMLGA